MLGDLNDPNVAPSWYVSIVNCTGKYNTGTREITNINCTSGMRVPGRCSDYGCDKGTNLGATNCKKNPDPSKPDPGCFGRSGSTVWLMGSSGNPFSCETRDGSCQEAIDNYKSGKCKDPNEPARPDPSSSDSPDPSSSDSPDPSSSDSPDPSSSDSPDPSSSSSGGGGGGGYDYRAVLAHIDNDLHSANGHHEKTNILLAGINQTISNYVVPSINRVVSGVQTANSHLLQVTSNQSQEILKLTDIDGHLQGVKSYIDTTNKRLYNIDLNLERNLSALGDSLHALRDTPISVTVNVSSPSSSPSSSDSEEPDLDYPDTLDYSDFVDDWDTSFYALGDSMHSRIMAHSSRVDSVISSMDSVLRWRDTVDADTNHNYLALDSVYNFSDTSAIKSKFSKLFFNTPAGGCFVCHLEITVFNKRHYREINFGNFAGVDICSIIRGLVRVFTCLIIIFTTVRSFIRAFSFGGD
ncbi:MAG: hypothetical protein MJY99_10720 [Fibrobacter sp.]|nr:hypothetical protein [Fibrobacter sp.]